MATAPSPTDEATHSESESGELPRGLRGLFLAHAIVQVTLGVPLLIVPETWAALVGWGDPFDPRMGQIAGGLFLGLAAGQALAFRADTWREVRLLLVTVFTEVLVLFVVFLTDTLPGGTVEEWGFVALSGAFLVAFLYYARNFLDATS